MLSPIFRSAVGNRACRAQATMRGTTIVRLFLLIAAFGVTLFGTTACDTVRSGVDSTLNMFSSSEQGPADVVRDAYGYQIVPGAALPPPWSAAQRQKFFSKRIVTMLVAHEQTDKDTGKSSLHFEFDPFVNAEDAEVTDFEASLTAEDERAAQVRANFRNKGKPTTMTFVLVQEEEGWRIDDVKSLDNDPKWVLSSLLKPES
jgi:hypothetical protein